MTTPRIQQIVNNFIAELSAALAEESSIAISSALSTLGGGDGGVPTPMTTKKKPGPKPKAAAKAGGRRSAEDVEAIGKQILAALKKKPEQSAEDLAVALGTSTKDLVLPITKLKEARALKIKGVRRGTRYSAK